MKSLNIPDAVKYLGEDKYAVSLEQEWYRRYLYMVGDGPTKLDRIGRFLDPDPIQFSGLFLAIADWLPKSSHRLLCIDHFAYGFPSQTRHFLNVLGPDLPDDYLVQNPGVLLGPLSDDLQDQLSGTPLEHLEGERLITLCLLLSVGNWDAKLLVKGFSDYVEFWEGNVFFHSERAEALDRAKEIFDYYSLKTPIQ
ncbi:hypothetical protein [uncultured Pseudosulfitobacter sp.]|uniref:hypothetical protein n=1 Tax=uncultured Pseudosulfitobacter sp. TaxID=2854214 RepID=UPI0030D7CE21